MRKRKSDTLAEGVTDETRVTAITCSVCKCTVYSRAGHDYRTCSCGAVAIDGGSSYCKVSWDPCMANPPSPFELSVKATKNELYNDWNYGGNKFGLIAPPDAKKRKSGTA